MALVTSATSKLYSGFDPRTIPGCIVWLDGADPNGDGTVPSNGATIASWKDKSGKGSHATSQVGTPTYSAASKCIYFNGSTYYKLPDGSIPTGNTAYSFYFVAAPTLADYQWIFSSGYNDTRAIGLVFYPNGTLEHGWWTTNVRTSAGVFTANQPALISGQYNVPGLYTYKNGTIVASNASSTNRNGAAANIHIGNRMDGTPSSLVQQFAGNIYEIILFDITTPDYYRQQIEGYLARKWGLVSSIPATHPYRNIPLATRPFTPLDISGCAFWVDAADTKTLTFSGSNVVGWADKSGYGYTGSNNGTITTTTLNGNTVLDFGSSRMTFSNYTQNVHSTTFIVAKCATGNFMFSMLQYGFYIYLGNWDLYYFSAGGDIIQFKDSVNANGTPVIPSNQYFVATIGYGGGSNTSVYNVNGTARSVTLTGGTPRPNVTITNPIYINGGSGNSFDSSQVCEILVYNNPMTNSQAQQVEGYLTAKWGLRGNFPSSHPFKIVPPLAPAFSPLQISSCRLWLDAADPSTLTLSGSNVSQWNDKSGNGYNVSQATSTLRPTYASNTVTFDGTDDIMNGTSISNLVTQSAYTTFFVGTILTQPAGGASYAGPAVWGDTDGYVSVYIASNAMGIYNWNGSAQYANVTPVSTSARVLFTGGHSNNTIYARLNGGTNTVTSSGNTDSLSGSFTLANQYNRPERGNFRLNELLIFSNALSQSDAQIVEGYLATKWGLKGSLPSTHGFKTITL